MKLEAFKSALAEFGRVVVLAIIPILVDSLTANKIDWKVIAITGAIAGLRFIDKYLHNLAPEGEAGGLVRF